MEHTVNDKNTKSLYVADYPSPFNKSTKREPFPQPPPVFHYLRIQDAVHAHCIPWFNRNQYVAITTVNNYHRLHMKCKLPICCRETNLNRMNKPLSQYQIHNMKWSHTNGWMWMKQAVQYTLEIHLHHCTCGTVGRTRTRKKVILMRTLEQTTLKSNLTLPRLSIPKFLEILIFLLVFHFSLF